MLLCVCVALDMVWYTRSCINDVVDRLFYICCIYGVMCVYVVVFMLLYRCRCIDGVVDALVYT